MSKTVYLVLIGLVSLNYLPGAFLGEIYSDLSLVLFLIIYIFGFINFKTKKNGLNSWNNKKWMYLTLFLLFYSTVYPVLVFKQGFIQTLIAQRYNVTLVFYLELLRIQPSEQDLYKAFRILTVLSLLALIIAIKFPLLYADEKRLMWLIQQKAIGESTDISAAHPGFQAILIYIFLSSRLLLKTGDRKYFVAALSAFILLILNQNRSTLLEAAPVIAYICLKAKYKYKSLFLIIGGIGVVYIGYNIISSLYEETVEQLGNDKYNRWQAIDFFLYEFPQNIYTVLFGHGVPCRGSSYLVELMFAQETRNAFVVDIGILGTFFYFGLFVVSMFYLFVFKGLLSNKTPIAFKFCCLGMLYTPWIQCWGIGIGNVVTCVIFYLLAYYRYYGQFYKNKTMVKEKVLNYGSVSYNHKL